MSPSATVLASELYARGLRGETIVRVCADNGMERVLDVSRWLGRSTPEEDDLLACAPAPVLDVGCGPGRHVLSLSRRGVFALGVDVAPGAVRLARRRGAPVIEASIFDDIPGAGTWGSALLLDGNVGIGGCPTALLTRVRSLLRPGGEAIVELDPRDAAHDQMRVRLEAGDRRSEWFPWARIGVGALGPIAGAAGYEVVEVRRAAGRCFARLSTQD